MSFGTPVQGGSGSAGGPVIYYQGQGQAPAQPVAPAGSGYTYVPPAQPQGVTGYVPPSQPQQTTATVGMPGSPGMTITGPAAGGGTPMPDLLLYLLVGIVGWGMIGLLRQGDFVHKLKPFGFALAIYLAWHFFFG